MTPLPHHYDVHLTGGPTGYAAVGSVHLPGLRVASPPQFDGPGDAWSPEHLLLASVQSCFLLTLRAMARRAKVDFVWLTVETSGTVDRQDGTTRFTGIVLRPTLTIAAGADAAKARELLERVERACLISASLATPVHIEPTVIEEPELVSQER